MNLQHIATLNVTRGIVDVTHLFDIFKVSLFFSLIGMMNTVILWPVVMLLYISGAG